MINNFQSNKVVICMCWDVLIVLCINFQRISAAILLSVICYDAVTYETLRIFDLGWLLIMYCQYEKILQFQPFLVAI